MVRISSRSSILFRMRRIRYATSKKDIKDEDLIDLMKSLKMLSR